MYNSRISPRKMVRNKHDLKFSPRRNRTRPISRISSKSSDSASYSSCANVKVIVRIRPPNSKELLNNSRIVVKVQDVNAVVFDPKEEDEPFFYHGVQQKGRDLLKKANKNIQFMFDKVFGYEANNGDVFDFSTKNLIPSLMDGYNCSVFVYGATGAGKTHTMLGHNGNPGITLLTMEELFTQINNFNNEREFELAITYLEVYNETVKDLLNPGPPLHLREDGKYGVCVSGIKVHRIKSPEELFALLEAGNENRTQHPTDANAESSRSHAVFQVYVNMLFRNTGQRRIAKLSMIDLAGSERGAATGCVGIRFTEGANINKSLLALGNCINSLADGQRHIPYRDSKLTRLLKDSLGGNCQTVMIANISPSSLNYEDTYNTLKYATRAKKIKSMMTKNVVAHTLTSSQYQKIIEDLNKENENLKEELSNVKSGIQITNKTCSCKKENNPEISHESKLTLQSMLKEKVNIGKQIHRSLQMEEILKQRIKFKVFPETLISDLSEHKDQMETGLNRIQTTVNSYQRKLSGVQTNIKELKVQQLAIETQLQNFVHQEQIPANNCDLLQSNIDLATEQFELQKMQTTKIFEICQAEIEQKEKLITKVTDVLNKYYQLLRINGNVTDDMVDNYQSVLRMAQSSGRTITWQDDKENIVSYTKSEDSGVNIQPTVITISSPTLKLPEKLVNSIEKRTTVKRKLYETETKMTSAIDNFIKKHIPEDTECEHSPNLNETIILTQSIDAGRVNNTFYLHEKAPIIPKKKSALIDRSNKIIPKATTTFKKPTSSKFNPSSKKQRFPLRKTAQESKVQK